MHRSLEEGKAEARMIASRYKHQLGEWKQPRGVSDDWDARCTRKGCNVLVGVDPRNGTLSYHSKFKKECPGK